MSNKVILTACALLIGGCGQQSSTEKSGALDTAPKPSAPVTQQVAMPDPAVSFEDLYSQAEAAVVKAVKQKAVWSDTESMLEESLIANAEGRSDAAMKLAFEAKIQAELAVAQAERESLEWDSRVLSDH